MSKYAFITGVTGQDGSYLSEILLEKGYKVYGMLRRSATLNTKNIEHIRKNLTLFYGDMIDMTSIINILSKIKKEINNSTLLIFNLAAQSHVKVSFELPVYTTQCDAIGVLNILEAIKTLDMIKQVKFYQASTSELFGKVLETPQNENTPFNPTSPYAIAKQYAHYIVKNYRDSYEMFACSGILFNHGSERRGYNFVTRKITLELSKIMRKEIDFMELGNLDSKRDWGYAKDYCKAMYLMLMNNKPIDYVIGSGKQYSVRNFVEEAFKVVNEEIIWEGNGLNEVGKLKKNNKIVVKINPKYFRPSEVETLLSDPNKAMKELKWKPNVNFKELVKKMVLNDLN